MLTPLKNCPHWAWGNGEGRQSLPPSPGHNFEIEFAEQAVQQLNIQEVIPSMALAGSIEEGESNEQEKQNVDILIKDLSATSAQDETLDTTGVPRQNRWNLRRPKGGLH